MTTSPSDATRSFRRLCPTHQWPLLQDGGCFRCEEAEERRARGLVVFAPLPPVAEWPRAFRELVFRRYVHNLGVHGQTDAERWELGWRRMTESVALEAGLFAKRLATTPEEAVHLLRQRYPDHWPLDAAATSTMPAGAAGQE